MGWTERLGLLSTALVFTLAEATICLAIINYIYIRQVGGFLTPILVGCAVVVAFSSRYLPRAPWRFTQKLSDRIQGAAMAIGFAGFLSHWLWNLAFGPDMHVDSDGGFTNFTFARGGMFIVFVFCVWGIVDLCRPKDGSM